MSYAIIVLVHRLTERLITACPYFLNSDNDNSPARHGYVVVEPSRPLYLACKKGYLAIARTLLKYGADVNAK